MNVAQLQTAQLSNFTKHLGNKPVVVVVHDESYIRKASGEKLAHLGWVKSLDGQWTRGYSTLNSIGVFIKEGETRLLACSPYSTQEPTYVTKKELKHLETAQLKDSQRRLELEDFLEQASNFDLENLLKAHISKIHQALKAENADCVSMYSTKDMIVKNYLTMLIKWGITL